MKSITLQHIHLLARMRRNPNHHRKDYNLSSEKPSISRILVISGLVNSPTTPAFRCTPCKDSRNITCKTCDRINYTNTVTTPDNITIKIRGNHNCQSQNCVCCLKCLCCNKMYIGESFTNSQQSNERTHESHIRNYPQTP